MGCRQDEAEKIKDKVNGFLYIGSGYFHPIGLHLKTKKPVLIFNPTDNTLKPLEQAQVKNFLKQKKAAKLTFLNANKVGVLVSTKTGQNNIEKAIKLKNRTDK